ARRDLDRVDLAMVLSSGLDWDTRQELERRFPSTLDLANGRRLRLRYDEPDRGPVASLRVQELYGVTVHPMIDSGRIPVLLELLSPAQRPIQVTADLAGFWRGTWSEVRKEMAGRYPKHDWPPD